MFGRVYKNGKSSGEQPLERSGCYDLSVSNEELLAGCARGDQESLRVLFGRHERPVYSLLYRMLGNHDDAEEALADVFVKVWRSASSFRGDASFTTWLYRIASNTARDVLRSRKSRPEVSLEDMVLNEAELLEHTGSDFEDPEEAVLRAAGNAVLAAAMARLSDEDRLLVALYHLQDRTYEEIAEIMKQPTANLKVKLFRARQRLKKHCQAIEDEQEDDRGLRDSAAEPGGIQPPATERL
jgi:RNA polymerase sigma-70 factor (ECF subfamily)